MGVIKKQGIQNTIVSYAGILIGFLNLIVIQPIVLTPEEIGLTRVLLSFSTLLSVLLPFGMGSITIKYFPHFRDKEKGHHGFFGFMILYPLAGFILTALLVLLFRNFFIEAYSKESQLFTEYFDYVFPLSFFLGFISVLNIYSFSLFKSTFPSFLNDILTKVLTIIVISLYFLKWISLDFFIAFYAGVYALQFIILAFYILSVDKPSLKINLKFLKERNLPEIMRYGLFLSLSSFAALGLRYLDTLLIGVYLPLAMAGIYSIASFVPSVIDAPLNSLERITITKISAAIAAKNTEEVKQIYYQSCRYLFILGGLIFLGININIKSLLQFLPEEYAQGAAVVFIISLGTLVNVAAGSNWTIILSSDKYRFGALLFVLLALFAFVSNIILIPRFGLNGAASATALTMVVFAFIRYIYIYRNFQLQPYDQKSLLTLLIICSVFAIGKFLPDVSNLYVDIFYKSVVITGVYLPLVYFLRLTPELHKHIPFLK